jgi:hypothetical protein
VRDLSQPLAPSFVSAPIPSGIWLNTLADRGGLSDMELARWMGRRDLRQNAAYKHGTVSDRVKKAREMIVDGSLKGRISETWFARLWLN